MDILQQKSYDFALRIVRLSEYLQGDRKEFALSKKILDEGKQGENKPDFIQKYSVANKEAFKTNFLLRLLRDSEKITTVQSESLISDCEELQKLLITSLKTARSTE